MALFFSINTIVKINNNEFELFKLVINLGKRRKGWEGEKGRKGWEGEKGRKGWEVRGQRIRGSDDQNNTSTLEMSVSS